MQSQRELRKVLENIDHYKATHKRRCKTTCDKVIY